MEQSEFKNRLLESTKNLIKHTESFVTNSITSNVEYLIEPNSREFSNHLNEFELERLLELNKIKGKLFASQEVAKILYDSGLIPLWINIEVFQSTKRKTVIKLICSRRFRNEKDLNKAVNKFPPFSVGVPLPPWYIEGEKFDINWRHQKLKRKYHALRWRLKNKNRS